MRQVPDWQEVVTSLLEDYTQAELSAKTKIPQSTISAIKRGKKRERLTFKNGIALLNALDEKAKTQ